jgi:hypothetical protein
MEVSNLECSKKWKKKAIWVTNIALSLCFITIIVGLITMYAKPSNNYDILIDSEELRPSSSVSYISIEGDYVSLNDNSYDCSSATKFSNPDKAASIGNHKIYFYVVFYFCFIIGAFSVMFRSCHLCFSSLDQNSTSSNFIIRNRKLLIMSLSWDVACILAIIGVTIVIAGIHTDDCLNITVSEPLMQFTHFWSILFMGLFGASLILAILILMLLKILKLRKAPQLTMWIYCTFMNVLMLPWAYVFFKALAQSFKIVGIICLIYIAALIVEFCINLKIYYWMGKIEQKQKEKQVKKVENVESKNEDFEKYDEMVEQHMSNISKLGCSIDGVITRPESRVDGNKEEIKKMRNNHDFLAKISPRPNLESNNTDKTKGLHKESTDHLMANGKDKEENHVNQDAIVDLKDENEIVVELKDEEEMYDQLFQQYDIK